MLSVNNDATGSSAVLFTNEKGEFDAAISVTGGSVTLDSTSDRLSYRKRGQVVTVFGQLQVSSVSSPTGTARITGLPFTNGAGTENSSDVAASIRPLNLTGIGAGTITGSLADGVTEITLAGYNGSTGFDIGPNIQAGTVFTISITYSV